MRKVSKIRTYSKMKESKNIRKVMEDDSDLEQATVLLAAKNIVTDLQNILVKLSDISAKQVMSLSDSITTIYDTDKASSFEESVNQAIQASIENIKDTKDAVNNAILVLDGQAPEGENDMSMEPSEDDMSAGDEGEGDDIQGGAAPDDSSDNDEMDEPASEGDTDEVNPEGRAKKESFKISGKILESRGKRILKEQNIKSLMNWLFEHTSTRMSPEDFKNFTKTAIAQAIDNPAKMAGWIASKKDSVSAAAQLSVPSTGSSARRAGIQLESKKKIN